MRKIAGAKPKTRPPFLAWPETCGPAPVVDPVIFLITRDKENHSRIAALLEGLQCPSPLAAADPAEALELAKTQPPDLLLVDLDAGEGPDCLKNLGWPPGQPMPPVIFLADKAQEHHCHRALAENPRSCQVKPVDKLALQAAVGMALTNRALEKQLSDQAGKLSALAENNPDAMVVVDQTGRVLFHNRAAKMMFGEKVMTPGGDFGFPLPTSPEGVEIYIKGGGGQWLVAQMRASGLGWEGQPATLASIRDITDLKRSQEERDLLRQQLLQSQKMDSLGNLASGVAHDFNNYLAGIMGFAELAADKAQKQTDSSYELNQVLNISSRASNLVNRILSFSRKMKGDRAPLDLNRQIKESLKLLTSSLPRKIEIEHKTGKNLKQIYADPWQIEQIIMNLAVNARDAMPRGGFLCLSTENRRVSGETCHGCGGVFSGNTWCFP